MASPPGRKTKQAKPARPQSESVEAPTKVAAAAGQPSPTGASEAMRVASADRETSKWSALTSLPLAAGITLLFVLGFHALIDAWPAGSVVTMFYVLCAGALWLSQKLLRRLRKAD